MELLFGSASPDSAGGPVVPYFPKSRLRHRSVPRKQKAERHFGIYALYVMFYPQLVAGPIERPQNLLPQFYEEKKFNYARATAGLKLMAWGFFKKVVVA